MSEEKKRDVKDLNFTDTTITYGGLEFQILSKSPGETVSIDLGFRYEEHGSIRAIKTVRYLKLETADVAEFIMLGNDIEMLHAAHMMRKLGWIGNDEDNVQLGEDGIHNEQSENQNDSFENDSEHGGEE